VIKGAALALTAAVSGAVAHAMLKSGRDKLVIRGLVGLTGGLLVLPFTLVVSFPTPALWPWLVFASALHTIYQLVLVRAYDAADFSVAYPLARGVVPVSTALLGIVLLGDRLDVIAWIGVVTVTAGLLLISLRRAAKWAGLQWAAAAGLLTTTYTIVDGHAVRLAPDAATFIVWFYILDGATMFPLAALLRRGRMAALIRAEGMKGVTAGVVSFVTYSSALGALRLLPVGAASALRETSVVFGTAIARFGLKEQVDARRAVGAVMIALGGALTIVGLHH